MTAWAILKRAEAAGLKLRLHNGRVRVQGVGSRPAHLLTELRIHRDDIAHLLALRTALQQQGSSDVAKGRQFFARS